MHTFRLAASATSNGEGSPKTPTPVDDSGAHHDLANGDDSSIFTLEPYAPSAKGKLNSATSSILHAKPIPLDWSFDIIYEEFSRFGNIKEIRNRLGNNYQYFESWIIFSSDEDALRAYNDFNSTCVSVSFAVPANVPKLLDIYRPYIPVEDLKTSVKLERLPVPPRWLILSSRSERGNLFKIKQFIGQKLGHVNSPDISRFGKDSFLVHTKSDAQAVMLLNMKLDTKSLVKGVKPHFTFSYAKGVFFNEDIYELSENEILTMCPDNVWKIFKVPKSNMIVLTFMDSIVPHEIIIENEIIKVRPYRQRPLQCFNCFGFAHVSDVCTRAKICQFCSQPEHGACTRPRVCANCRESHDSRNKSCNIFKKEQEALLLSAAEHISIGHAKKLLSQRSYSAAVQDFHPKPALSTTGLDRPQTVQSKTSRASSGGDPGASSGGASRASSGGAPRASSGGAPRASSGGAPRASSGGAPRAFSCGALPVSSGGAPRASSGGASRASSGGAPRASSGGAPRASSGGAPRASSGGAPRASSGGAPRASSGGAPRAFSCGALPVSSGGAPRASSGGASRASSGGAPRASSGGAPRASSGGAPRASSGGAPRASSGGAPRASSGGAPRASSGGAPRASSGGAPRASSGGAPRAFSCGALPVSSGGAPRASSGGASRASSGGAPRASSGGAPRASSGGAPRASSGGAPRASSGGAPRAFSCGALPVSSGGASRTSAGGASGVPPHGTSSSSLKTPQTSGVPQGSSHNSGIRFEPQSPDCSLAQSGSPSNLNYFSLSGSLPDLQNLPDSNENFKIVVHKTMDAEEVESIAVGQKRARSPSSPHSNSHGVGRNAKSKTGRANEGPSNKKSAVEPKSKGGDKSKSSVKVIPGKVSLSRSQIPKLDSKKHPSKSK